MMPSKGDAKKKQLNLQSNRTISHFFKKVNKDINKVVIVENNVDDDNYDEDIIESTPERPSRPKVLENVTNVSPPHSTQKVEDKKRKGCYPNDIPELDFDLPQRKKPCTLKNGIKVVSLADISQDEFKTYQEDLEKSLQSKSSSSTANMKTPEKRISPRKKMSSSGKKRRPKLFDSSPNKAKDFKVEILQNYVRITPSKSEKNELQWRVHSPVRSSEKKQQSILKYASPTCSQKTHAAKSENEKTPINRPSQSGRTPTPGRAKIKLDFTLSNTLVTVLPSANGSNGSVRLKNTPKKSPFKADALFDDSWDKEFEFTASYDLDLGVPQHCKILEISSSPSKITIVVLSTKSEEKAICYLSGFWVHTNLKVGSTVYIQAFYNSIEWCIDNNNGLLVFEPDYLISSTTLVGAVFCKRKCVLKERFGGFDPQNKIMIVGNLVHSLLQESLKRNLQTEDAITTIAQQLVTSRTAIRAMFESSYTVQEVEEDIRKFVPRVLTFMQQYLSSNAGKYPLQYNKDDWHGKIDKIQDIEENIWCPELGIKGKVDVSVQVGDSILPLELKTGRASMSLEHRGQVILYIMMMNKLGYNVSSGLLLYLKEGVLRDIPMNNNEKRDLIIMRNEIAYYLTRKPQIVKAVAQGPIGGSQGGPICDIEELVSSKLPPPINHHSACGKCEYNIMCSTFLREENYNLDGYKHLKQLQPEVLGYLDQSHINYFTKWCSLLELENIVEEGKPVRDIYVKTPEEREKLGRCLTNMGLYNDVSECNGIFCTTFQKKENQDEHCNILSAGISESNYVIVSTKKRPAVASGIVTHVDYKSITIELDRDLNRKFQNGTFTLDTYDSTSTNTFNFANMSLLLAADERASHLRRLIIDKESPTFKKSLPKLVLNKSISILVNMNSTQQLAIIKAVSANDYLLIKGMPGTGKTATIVTLVLLLVEVNFSVLITSHTHSAVDNLCLRLLECGVKVLRLGAESRIHPNLKKCSEHYMTKHCKTPEELNDVYNKVNVLAVTCLGSKHPILSKRKMDFCIVDESTQVLQCSLIRALHTSKKFILIGDPDQLPPIVKNKEALSRGMSESLFERLACKTEATVTLELNYRMNKTITALANHLTYNGQLLIANDKVANANLRIPKFESMAATYNNSQWILNAVNDELEKAVYVLDTGPVWNKTYKLDWLQQNDENEAAKYVNPSECAIVMTVAHALIKGGVSPANIGVIAPFRTQVAQLAALLQPHGMDVSTVDQFQGKDKEVIIYSCTKSRDISVPRRVSKFEILEDQRRLTVAITRAKHKFILVADVATVREYSPFAKIFNYIDNDCYLKLIDGTMGFNWEQVIGNCSQYLSK